MAHMEVSKTWIPDGFSRIFQISVWVTLEMNHVSIFPGRDTSGEGDELHTNSFGPRF